MAATLANGETVLKNCALEPEVAHLAALLSKMGARIMAPTRTGPIQRRRELGGAATPSSPTGSRPAPS